MINGVYQIRNVIDGKRYIGSATNIPGRWRGHRSSLNLGKHHSIHLQRAWTKHGANNFIFEVIEQCSVNECVKQEQFYLDTLLFASHDDDRFHQLGYNVARIAGEKFRLGMKHTTEARLKIGNANKGKPSPNKGKTASVSTRRLLSLSHIGQNLGMYQGSKHPQAKLSDEDVKNIKRLLDSKVKGRDIAKQYQVSEATISMIRHNRHWSHIHA